MRLNSKRQLTWFASIVLTILVNAGCGSSPPPINVVGNWVGTVSDSDITPPSPGTASLSLTEDSYGNLIGTFDVGADGCGVDNDSMTGKITGTQMSLSSTQMLFQATVQATVNSTGSHLDGTFQLSLPGLGCGAGGSISLSRQ